VLELGLRVLVVGLIWVHPHTFFTADPYNFWERTRDLSWHYLPYRDFLWEFPPLTVLAILPAPLLSHTAYIGAFVALMVAAEYGSLLALRGLCPANAWPLTCYWTIAGLPLAILAWFRLDYLSVFFATCALVAIVRAGRGSAAITAGFAAKIWPVALVIGLVVQRRARTAVATVVGVAATVAVWFAFSPEGFRDFLRYRRGSGFQVESLIGSVRMLARPEIETVSQTYVTDAGRYHFADTLFVLAWCAVVAVVTIYARRRPIRLVPLLGGLVGALLVLSRILSPQYLVWLLPFVALEWVDGERLATIAFGVAGVLTLVVVEAYHTFLAGNRLLVLDIIVRNVLLIIVTIRLLHRGFTPRAAAAEQAPAATIDLREVAPTLVT
jgi:hypothetical protein